MYIPAAYRVTDTERLHDFIRQNSFALLVSAASDGTPFATHVPFYFDADTGEHGTLFTHLARPNPQWMAWEGENVSPAEAMVVFSGPHAYVSPRWYADPQMPSVPTWDYAAVHAYGIPRLLSGSELRTVLSTLTAQYEPEGGWRMESLPGEYIEKMTRGIIGVAITITRLEGKWKMSQNRSVADRIGVIGALREIGFDQNALVTANEMEAILNQQGTNR